MLKKQKPAYIGMESIGLYHQTGSGTSRFLLEKSISRPHWRGSAGHLGFLGRMSGGLSNAWGRDPYHSQAGLHERSRFPRGDVRANDLQILAGDFEGMFGVMVGYKSGVVVKGCISLPAEPVEYGD